MEVHSVARRPSMYQWSRSTTGGLIALIAASHGWVGVVPEAMRAAPAMFGLAGHGASWGGEGTGVVLSRDGYR